MIEFHRQILGDRMRNDTLAAALKKVIVPGETTVADLGSGTGLLSFVASKLGAKHCWLYEVSTVADLSREIARQNGIENCTFVRSHSLEVKNPVRVDVVISETLGHLAFEENVIETTQDAKRFLKPKGILIPQKLKQFVAPITSPRLYDYFDIWPRIGHGLDFTEARRISMNNVYVRTITPADLLAGPDARREWDAADFRKKTSSVRRATVEWKLAAPAKIYGFALWWRCELIEGEPDLVISTSPDSPLTHWEQVWLPPPPKIGPLDVRVGETLRLALECDSRPEVKINLKWTTTLLDCAGKVRATEVQDMQKGYAE